MNTREVAEAAISLLREEGWHKGSAVGPDGSLCLASALTEGVTEAGTFSELPEIERLWKLTLGHIRDMFPGRLDPNHQSIADFNDHPHTTEQDVLLVLKHMAEGE